MSSRFARPQTIASAIDTPTASSEAGQFRSRENISALVLTAPSANPANYNPAYNPSDKSSGKSSKSPLGASSAMRDSDKTHGSNISSTLANHIAADSVISNRKLISISTIS